MMRAIGVIADGFCFIKIKRAKAHGSQSIIVLQRIRHGENCYQRRFMLIRRTMPFLKNVKGENKKWERMQEDHQMVHRPCFSRNDSKYINCIIVYFENDFC